MKVINELKIFSVLLTFILFIASMQITTYAQVGDSDIEELIDSEVVEVKKSSLTPEGNLTLVDDIVAYDESEKQFITAVTKNGNYFYLVIDKSNDKDNVYLLNLVDEADLMSLMDGDEVTIEDVKVEPKEMPVVIETPVVEEVEILEEEKQQSVVPTILTLIILGVGGVFYYIKFVKGSVKSTGNTDLSELSEDDDDEIYFEVEEDLVNNLEDYEEDI